MERIKNMNNLEALEEAILASAKNDGLLTQTYLANTCPSDLAYEILSQLQKMGYEITDKDS